MLLILFGFAFVLKFAEMAEALLSTLIFVIVGLIFFVLSMLLLDKVLPYSIHKEIEEDQNIALGIIIGSMLIGIAIIIAVASHG